MLLLILLLLVIAWVLMGLNGRLMRRTWVRVIILFRRPRQWVKWVGPSSGQILFMPFPERRRGKMVKSLKFVLVKLLGLKIRQTKLLVVFALTLKCVPKLKNVRKLKILLKMRLRLRVPG